MSRAEEFISKKEHELEQLRKDWHPELWALVMEAYAKSQEGGWISVEDDLPPEGTKRYLIIRDGEVSMDTWITRDGKSFWYNYLGLTHWTTLPEPPKTKDNE